MAASKILGEEAANAPNAGAAVEEKDKDKEK